MKVGEVANWLKSFEPRLVIMERILDMKKKGWLREAEMEENWTLVGSWGTKMRDDLKREGRKKDPRMFRKREKEKGKNCGKYIFEMKKGEK